MGLYIRSEEVAGLVRELAAREGKTMTQVVGDMARKELGDRPAPREAKREAFFALIRDIRREVAQLPVLDPRSPEEMLYDKDGLPK